MVLVSHQYINATERAETVLKIPPAAFHKLTLSEKLTLCKLLLLIMQLLARGDLWRTTAWTLRGTKGVQRWKAVKALPSLEGEDVTFPGCCCHPAVY